MCAIITDRRNNILSIGLNSYNKTHPKQAFFAKRVGEEERIFLHAEIDALIKADMEKARKIWIARVGRDGIVRASSPCPICSAALCKHSLSIINT